MSLKDSEEVPEKGAMDKKEKEETEKKEADDTKKDEKDQDVVFVQDVGFTVKIIAPNLEPFDIQVVYFNYFFELSMFVYVLQDLCSHLSIMPISSHFYFTDIYYLFLDQVLST